MSHLRKSGIAAVLVLLGAAPQDGANSAASSPTREQLESRVAALEARNRDLERKNSELLGQVVDLNLRLSAVSRQQTLPDRSRVPENWKREKFDGMTFYLVPLNAGQPVLTTRPSR